MMALQLAAGAERPWDSKLRMASTQHAEQSCVGMVAGVGAEVRCNAAKRSKYVVVVVISVGDTMSRRGRDGKQT